MFGQWAFASSASTGVQGNAPCITFSDDARALHGAHPAQRCHMVLIVDFLLEFFFVFQHAAFGLQH